MKDHEQMGKKTYMDDTSRIIYKKQNIPAVRIDTSYWIFLLIAHHEAGLPQTYTNSNCVHYG